MDLRHNIVRAYYANPFNKKIFSHVKITALNITLFFSILFLYLALGCLSSLANISCDCSLGKCFLRVASVTPLFANVRNIRAKFWWTDQEKQRNNHRSFAKFNGKKSTYSGLNILKTSVYKRHTCRDNRFSTKYGNLCRMYLAQRKLKPRAVNNWLTEIEMFKDNEGRWCKRTVWGMHYILTAVISIPPITRTVRKKMT